MGEAVIFLLFGMDTYTKHLGWNSSPLQLTILDLGSKASSQRGHSILSIISLGMRRKIIQLSEPWYHSISELCTDEKKHIWKYIQLFKNRQKVAVTELRELL